MLVRDARPASSPATISMASKSKKPGLGGSVAWRQHIALGNAACYRHLPPLRRTGVPRWLSGGGVRKRPADRHRAASGRSVHRLPVLHFEMPVRRSQIQPCQGDRAQVRYVQQPAGRGRGAGVRAGLPEPGDPHHSRQPTRSRRRRGSQPVPARARPEPGYTLPTTVYKTERPCRGICCRRTIMWQRLSTRIGRWC